AAARPSADAFARALYASCSPEPVRLVEGATAPADLPVTVDVLPPRGSAVPPRVGGTLPRPAAKQPRAPAAGRGHRRRWWSPDRRRLAGRTAVASVGVLLLGGAIAGGVGWAARDHRAMATPAALEAQPAAINDAAASTQ